MSDMKGQSEFEGMKTGSQIISIKPRHSFLIEEEEADSRKRTAKDEDLQEIMKNLKSWSFDIFQIQASDLPKMVEKIFEDLGLFDAFPLNKDKFLVYVKSIMNQYRMSVPYHNFRHACDVLHAVYLMLVLVEADKKLNSLEKLALALAALCHDVDHPGLTNNFLMAINDPLAIRYNDISVLESHHASTSIKTLLAYESMSILSDLSEVEQRHIRKLMIVAILATDMANHFKIVEALKTRNADPKPFEASQPHTASVPSQSSPNLIDKGIRSEVGDGKSQSISVPSSSDDAILLMQMIIKCADISNVTKPFILSKRWAALLLIEWFRQGDLERRLGLPVSKNMDRENPDGLQSMTIGCIDFLGKPMYEETAGLLPKLHDEVLQNLETNRTEWAAFTSTGSSQETAERILSTFDSGVVLIRQTYTSSAVKPRPQQPDDRNKSTPVHTRSSDLRNSGSVFVETSATLKRNSRPLSLLFEEPLEEEKTILHPQMSYVSRRHRDSSVSQSSHDSLRNSSQEQSSQLQEASVSLSFHPAKVLGKTIWTQQLGGGRSSFQIGTLHLPWEKGTLWEGSTNDTQKSKESSPLSIQVDSVDVSFWKIVRSQKKAVKLNQFLDSKFWALIIVPATALALFSEDVIRVSLPKYADEYVIPIYLICLAVFVFELVALSVVRDHYFLGLSFWLDFLGSISLVPLILGILQVNLIMARVSAAAKSFTRVAKQMQRASFSKAAIIASLKKLFRWKDSGPISHDGGDKDSDSDYYYQGKPSQVWTRLTELTTQKLVLGMLLLVIVVPRLRIYVQDNGPTMSLNSLDHSPIYSMHFNYTLQQLYGSYRKQGYQLLYLGTRLQCIAPAFYANGENISSLQDSQCQGFFAKDKTYYQVYPPEAEEMGAKKNAEEKFRNSELLKVVSHSGRSEAYFSIERRSRRNYGFDLASTSIVLLILSAWSFFLSWDSNKLLIQPIERMVGFVKELSEDPVSFAGKVIPNEYKKGDAGKVMETRVVEAALIKIASLTKVALGDAGMDILSVNLKGTAFNPMIPGKKVRACFGFCDIRNFTDATECLQEDIMVFVNKIADLVHSKVMMYHGFPNKNIGDAFLIVWKKTITDAANKKRGSSFADRALRSFLDIIYSVETSRPLQAYAMHPAIQRRMPGYRIRMGFGLHVGWAIEGAIGSSNKVDPSYLSPHVNMASRLEAATKQYGVVILISETVVANLTKGTLRDSCRRLDRVTVKGSFEPMILYTYDMPLFQMDLKGNYMEYKTTFEAAVDNYIAGNWREAIDKLYRCQHVWPTDKPINVLLNFMASHKNTLPQNWKGYRELTEK